MSSATDIGVVIQGTLASQDFDCHANVRRLVEEYRAHPRVRKVLLSTWEGEQIDLGPEVPVVCSSVVTGGDAKNRLKQFQSTYRGVERLGQDEGIGFVLKLRTDQYVPPKSIDFVHAFYETPGIRKSELFMQLEAPLLFSYVNRTIPFHIGDYFFAGKTGDMMAFLRNVLSFGRFYFQLAVEVDVVLKHLYRADPAFPIPFRILHKQMCIARQFPRGHLVWDYWLEQYSRAFGCFPREVLKETLWRGVPFAEFADQHLFLGRATEVVDGFYDYFDEWTLLRTDRDAYEELPLDVQHDKIRPILDWWNFIKRIPMAARGSSVESNTFL